MDEEKIYDIITLGVLIVSIIILIFSICFGIFGSLSLRPLDPMIFWIFMISCMFCLVPIVYLILQAVAGEYDSVALCVPAIIMLCISMIILILCVLGLYEVFQDLWKIIPV